MSKKNRLINKLKFRNINLSFILCIIVTHSVNSNTYFISNNGSDQNNGSISTPFKTINYALEKLKKGDTLYFREGVYFISKELKIKSDTYISAYQNEIVEIHGTEKIEKWEQVSSKIWKSNKQDSVIQLFINQKPYFQASYPDIPEGMLSITHGAYAVAYPNKNVYIEGLSQFENLSGNRMIGLHGDGLVSLNGKIINKNGNNIDVENDAFYWNESFKTAYLDTGKAFVLGSKQFMNTEKEWYWEKGELFLFCETNPNLFQIETRSSLYTFDLENISNTIITGITFIGANLNLSNAKNCKITNCKLTYVTPFFYFPDGFERFKNLVDQNNQIYFDPTEKWTGKGITVSGSNNTIENCYIAHSWGDGLTVWGSNQTIRNNEIYDCDWIANDCAPLTITGSGHIVEYNTIHNAGRSVLVHRKLENSIIKNNHLFDAGILCEDLGVTYCYDTDGKNTEIAYNYIHNNFSKKSGAGIYLDNTNSNFKIHHNIVTNSLVGININKPSENILLYNNTLFNNNYSMGCWGPDGTTIRNVKAFNNLTNTDKKAKWNYDSFYGTSLDSNYVYYDNNIFVDPQNENFQLRKYSYPINTGIKNEYTLEYKDILPDKGAIEYATTPWSYGSTLVIPNEEYFPPKAPINLKLIKNTFDTYLFHWNYPYELVDSFYVERRISSESEFKIIARVAATQLNYNDAIQPTGENRYQIRAKNQYGISEPSNSIQLFNPVVNNSLYFDAEYADLQVGTKSINDILNSTDNKDWICFKNINLDSVPFDACMVNMGVPCEYAWQEIQVRIDKPMGRLIGKYRPPSTGGWDIFKTRTFPIESLKGIHDVYFRFKGDYGIGTIDWFTFYNSKGEVKESIPYDSICPFPTLKNKEVKMKIFPNPTYQNINLTFDCQEKTSIEIELFDANGVIYYSSKFENLFPGTIEIDLSDDEKVKSLNPGVYMVKTHVTSKKVDTYVMNKFIKINE